MDMTQPWIAAAAGAVCGILSAFGIGGGSLLMVWLTAVAAVDQKTAQGINLLYFLPAAACALIFHARNKLICRRAVVPGILFGSAAAFPAACFSASVDITFLRKLFGVFLLIIGISQLLRKKQDAPGSDK